MSNMDAASVPEGQKGSWMSFLKSISGFSGDLSALTAPPFILSPISLVEYSAYWGEPVELFNGIAEAKTSEERALAVLRWFISTLPGQFTKRETDTGSEKKPFNPILGEQFLGSWPHDKHGETSLICEQVSHHPPVTAYYISNKSSGISLQGHCAQKTSFSSGKISVKQVGHAILKIDLGGGDSESYLMTLPELRIEGLWYGSPYVELCENSYIQSSAGHHIKLEYKGKGWVSGVSHTFRATLSPFAQAPPYYTIDGSWTGTSKFTKVSKNAKAVNPSTGKPYQEGDLFIDNVATKKTEISVVAIENQNEYESRRVWKLVAEGIRSGNFTAASTEKTTLENGERQKRRDEAENGTPWETRLFDRIEEGSEYTKLAQLFGYKPATEEIFVCKQITKEESPEDAANS